MLGHVIQRQPAFAFFRAAAAERDEPRQAAVGGAVGRPEDQRRGIGRRDFRADDELHAELFGGHVGADDSGQAVSIGHRDGRVAQFGGAIYQFLRVRSAFEEGEVRFGVKLGVHGSIKHSMQKPGAVGQAAKDPIPTAGGRFHAIIIAGHGLPAPPAGFDPLRPDAAHDPLPLPGIRKLLAQFAGQPHRFGQKAQGRVGWDKRAGHPRSGSRALAHHRRFPLTVVGLRSLEARLSHPTLTSGA